jgi:hypothetical protein
MPVARVGGGQACLSSMSAADLRGWEGDCSTSTPQRQPQLMRKSMSMPTLNSMGRGGALEDGLEVYVVCRNFQEFAGGLFHRLPVSLRDGIRDVGICHYMTIFRQPDGTLTQFDFGPTDGGDIHLWPGPFGMLGGRTRAAARRQRQVAGEIRESTVSSI